MKKEELRIGNYVSYYSNKTPFQIESVEKDEDWSGGYKVEGGNSTTAVGSLVPIPLTEEWLINFGFTIDFEGTYFFDIKNHDLTESSVFLASSAPYKEVLLLCEHQNNCIMKSDFVHQLQNLFFSLTGEELKQNK